MKKINWWIWGTGIVIIALVAWLAVWIMQGSQVESKLPGQAVATMSRDHVQDISGIKYDSNPPTSGPHFPIWAQRGAYNEIFAQGFLIHSLEHGYIVMSYNCGPLAKHTPSVTYAKNAPLTKLKTNLQFTMQPFTPQSNLPPAEVALPKDFSTSSCQNTVKQLSTFLDSYHRIVIVPDNTLDSPIIFRAWGRIERFKKFDKSAMVAFIEAFHNKGPEQTIE